MRLLAIDPGVQNTGVTSLSATSDAKSMTALSVCRSETIRHRAAKRHLKALYRHCDEITQRVLSIAAEEHPNVVVMEDFIGYKGCDYIYLSQTPKLCAWLYSALVREGYEVALQTSEIFRRNRKGNVAWVRDKVKEGVEVVPGALLCTNEHERSALAHAIYYLRGIGYEG